MFLGIGQAAQHAVGAQAEGMERGRTSCKGKVLGNSCSLVRVLSGASWRSGSDPCARLLCQGCDLQGCLLWGGGEFLSSLTFCRNRAQTVWLAFHPFTETHFFSRAWKCTSTAQENHFPPSSPHEMKAVTGRILLFVDLGTWWNDSHRSEVNMFLRLLLFISRGFMGFPVHGQGNSSFTCVCADEL